MDLMVVAFPLAWLTLMMAPVVALVARFRLARPNLVAAKAAIVLGLVALGWLLSVEFAWRPINWIALAAAYLAWAVIVGAVFTLHPRLLGKVLGVIGMVTFFPGLALGTIGVLGLLFIVGDYSGSPARSVMLKPGLDCVVTNWGSAVTDDGHEVHLYRYFPWFPILRYQARRVVVDKTNPRSGVPANTGCREVADGVR